MLGLIMVLAPNNCPALVLNADFQPLSYFPLSTWSWKDALKAVFLERVNIVSEYSQVVRSPSTILKLPSVVSLKDYIALPEKAAFTRFNVFLRDKFVCQYCHKSFKVEELTFDHVLPRSKGGKTTWENVVTACRRCNTLKGNKLLEKIGVTLKMKPSIPNNYKLKEIGRMFPPNLLHQSWNDFLYWDSELEP
ncbi:MAG: HNH endonuclease [Pseudomonadota bacterium]|nr:HNH endonuclease [Pseudomonadota bacterium]